MLELNKIYCMDALDFLRDIPDKTVNLIVIDPPYFRVMTNDWKGGKHDWDNQWDSLESYISWIGKLAVEFKRILKLNGSFYIFADDKNCAYVQVELDKYFNLENNIIWVKPNNMTMKGWTLYRGYAPITERILFYSNESRNSNLENEFYAENVKIFEPIVEYMKEQKRKIKEYFNFKTDEEFNEYINKVTDTKSVVSRHYFCYSQWVFPTKEIYEKLQKTGFFRREYEELRREYEELRRYFNPKKNFTDVWTFNIMGGDESLDHPTQKPIKLINRIIETSSKEGDLVVDCFAGSGTTAESCHKLNRNFLCCDNKQEYIDMGNSRLIQKPLHKFN